MFFAISSIIVLFLLLSLSVYRHIQTINAINDAKEQLEIFKNDLNNALVAINRATSTEVISDDPIVRRVVYSIKSAKVSLENVLNKIDII